jgi:hypothetical protein
MTLKEIVPEDIAQQAFARLVRAKIRSDVCSKWSTILRELDKELLGRSREQIKSARERLAGLQNRPPSEAGR